MSEATENTPRTCYSCHGLGYFWPGGILIYRDLRIPLCSECPCCAGRGYFENAYAEEMDAARKLLEAHS